MRFDKLDSDILQYLVQNHVAPGERVPSLTELSEELGISVGKLREQLELARHLEIVSVRPRKGIRREPFDFRPALLTSLMFGLATDEATFKQYSQLRQRVEAGFWLEAVQKLTSQDIQELRALLSRARGKLHGTPPHIPNQEHRDFHLKLFARLDNPFVNGVLEAYWDAYDAVEVTAFASYRYWLDVWDYHERIVDAIEASELERSQELLVAHFALLREAPNFSQNGNSS